MHRANNQPASTRKRTDLALKKAISLAPRPPDNVRALIAYGNVEQWFKKYQDWFTEIRRL
jgi:hypothetical protein